MHRVRVVCQQENTIVGVFAGEVLRLAFGRSLSSSRGWLTPLQNRPPYRLRTTAGSGPRLWRGAGGLRRARPRQRGRAPSAAPPPPFGRQPQPRPIRPFPPPSTGAPAATVRPGPEVLLRRAAPVQAFFRRLLAFGAAWFRASGRSRSFEPSCFVSFRRPHPQRTGSTLAVRPPHLPRMRPIGAGTPLFACSEKRSQRLNHNLKLFWTAVTQTQGHQGISDFEWRMVNGNGTLGA